MGRYHFYRRIDRHKPLLEKRERKLEKEIKHAVKNLAKRVRVHVHPSHVHVFAEVTDEKRGEFVETLHLSLTGVEGTKWDSQHYLMPVSSLSPEYVSRLLKDLHKDILL